MLPRKAKTPKQRQVIAALGKWGKEIQQHEQKQKYTFNKKIRRMAVSYPNNARKLY